MKPGVGVVVDLGSVVDVRRVRVTSPTAGWDGEIHVAGGPDGGALPEWGPVVGTPQAGVAGAGTFELPEGTRGRAVLVWFTRLGEDRRMEVGEITVEG